MNADRLFAPRLLSLPVRNRAFLDLPEPYLTPQPRAKLFCRFGPGNSFVEGEAVEEQRLSGPSTNDRAPPLGPLLRWVRHGRRVCVAAFVVPAGLFDGALHLPAISPGFLVIGFARLLPGSGCPTVTATLVATVHAIRLRGRRRDASEHHDCSKDTNASPRPHLS